MADLATDGFAVFDADPRVARWATQAHDVAYRVSCDPDQRSKWLRHGQTWFVGVDALPNAPDGSIDGVPLAGPWQNMIGAPKTWHRAQISIVYEDYPKRDDGDSEVAHRFRVNRCSAHVDGLHLEGGRRIVREPHAFILGLPLNDSEACPLVVWPGSHTLMGAALRRSIKTANPIGADVTEIYKAARLRVFETCTPIEVPMRAGQAVVLDRFALHGVAPWRTEMSVPPQGRMIAYFRPECCDIRDWLRV